MTQTELLALPESLTLYGQREGGEIFVTINGEYLDIRPSLKIENHSPTGFNWGYGGSGPAQLALAILMEFLPVKKAQAYKQDFKWKVIAPIKEDEFTIVIPFREIMYVISKNTQSTA
jgi:hypothetical protein